VGLNLLSQQLIIKFVSGVGSLLALAALMMRITDTSSEIKKREAT
jgi:hypothetical protein